MNRKEFALTCIATLIILTMLYIVGFVWINSGEAIGSGTKAFAIVMWFLMVPLTSFGITMMIAWVFEE